MKGRDSFFMWKVRAFGVGFFAVCFIIGMVKSFFR